jgi:retrograde regulation protein 2
VPCIYADRAAISLYDAQWQTTEQAPIPEDIIVLVVQAMCGFQRTCKEFGVPESQIRVLATEATRTATNSEEFRGRIKDATGWTVHMLPKEEEGRVGAMGVASSFSTVRGLMMDLGGGSTQLTWIICENGELKMSEAGSVSMPYGAAALSRRLAAASKAGGQAMAELRDEITGKLRAAVEAIGIPESLLKEIDGPNGLTLYCSGGGFRGWGFVLMSEHPVRPYPIPIINGFKTSTSEFLNASVVMAAASDEQEIFRVSERRADQVPAVATLVCCLAEAFPVVKTIYFAQGGVREGALFLTLDRETRGQNPLETATSVFATPSSPALAALLLAALPSLAPSSAYSDVNTHIIKAFAQSLNIYSGLNKDIQAASGLRSTTTGVLAGTHGVTHEERAIFAIMQCERWGGVGALSPNDADFWKRLIQLIGPDASWWALYFGRIGAILGHVYPAGVVGDDSPPRITINASWSDGKDETNDGETAHKSKKDKKKYKKHGHEAKTKLVLDVELVDSADIQVANAACLKALEKLEKLGKKKNWPGESGGHKIVVNTRVSTA